MVKKKVRTQFSKNSQGKEKSKNSILTFQKKNPKGKEKGKNAILTFGKKSHVKQKVRTQFLLFKKPKQTNKQNPNKQTYTPTNNQTNMVRRKVRTQFLLLKKKTHGKEKGKKSILTFQKKQTNKHTNK